MCSYSHIASLLMAGCPQICSNGYSVLELCEVLHRAILLDIKHIYNILPNGISRHHLEHWLQSTTKISESSMINNRQRVLMHTYHQCKFLSSKFLIKNIGLQIYFPIPTF